jgi:hypothetical protein
MNEEEKGKKEEITFQKDVLPFIIPLVFVLSIDLKSDDLLKKLKLIKQRTNKHFFQVVRILGVVRGKKMSPFHNLFF